MKSYLLAISSYTSLPSEVFTHSSTHSIRDPRVPVQLTLIRTPMMHRRKATGHPPTNNFPSSTSDRHPGPDPESDSDPAAYSAHNPLAPTTTSSHQPTANGHPHTSSPLPLPSPLYLPSGPRSLSGISLRSFLLGCTFSLSVSLALQLALHDYFLWRIPFFTTALSLFHYLEFDMTARFNPADAKLDSFLLTANGRGYNAAHACAVVECLVRGVCRSYGWGWELRWLPSLPVPHLPLALGLLFILIGQTSRTLAMATAGPSFNHLVQSTKRDNHVLITTGIYGWSRHPSYFGFFWWGLGTQLVLGNWVCLVGYTVVLWGFFWERIRGEERLLREFFGGKYLRYRGRVGVGIPGIR